MAVFLVVGLLFYALEWLRDDCRRYYASNNGFVFLVFLNKNIFFFPTNAISIAQQGFFKGINRYNGAPVMIT